MKTRIFTALKTFLELLGRGATPVDGYIHKQAKA
jgi:hypothetical protein